MNKVQQFAAQLTEELNLYDIFDHELYVDDNEDICYVDLSKTTYIAVQIYDGNVISRLVKDGFTTKVADNLVDAIVMALKAA